MKFLQPVNKVEDKIITRQFCCIWSTFWKINFWNLKEFLTIFWYLNPCKIMKTNFICKSSRKNVVINSVNTFVTNLVILSIFKLLKISNMLKNYEKLNFNIYWCHVSKSWLQIYNFYILSRECSVRELSWKFELDILILTVETWF